MIQGYCGLEIEHHFHQAVGRTLQASRFSNSDFNYTTGRSLFLVNRPGAGDEDVDKLNPRDEPNFHQIYGDLRSSLAPDGPAEEHLLKELAVFSARLQTLEAAQFALIAGNIEGTPPKIENPQSYTDAELHDLRQPDARAIAAAYERSLDTIERLTKIETHLRRAYNRTWDRLERMQRERHKLPLDEMLKRTQAWLNAEARRTNRPQDIPARDQERTGSGETSSNPDSVVRDVSNGVDEKGKLIVYPKDHPLWRPKKGEEDDDDNEQFDPKE